MGKIASFTANIQISMNIGGGEVGGLVVDNSPDSVAKLSEADF